MPLPPATRQALSAARSISNACDDPYGPSRRTRTVRWRWAWWRRDAVKPDWVRMRSRRLIWGVLVESWPACVVPRPGAADAMVKGWAWSACARPRMGTVRNTWSVGRHPVLMFCRGQIVLRNIEVGLCHVATSTIVSPSGSTSSSASTVVDLSPIRQTRRSTRKMVRASNTHGLAMCTCLNRNPSASVCRMICEARNIS